MSPEELAQSLFPTRLSSDFSDQLLDACQLALEAQALPMLHSVSSLEACSVLTQLNLDDTTYIATLVSDSNLIPYYSSEDLAKRFAPQCVKLIDGIRRLNQFKEFDPDTHSDAVQTERLRQMLLAMTSDIRMMVVKLGYRVARLRNLKHEPETVRKQIAAETQLIFAPLANRLGIAQLKWELEDLSFRFLEPDLYKKIASELADKRVERENYIANLIAYLTQLLADDGIEAKVTGRPKHIYSIWKKMSRKKQSLDDLYDLRALRIYVKDVAECYRCLSLVHEQWNFIREEFDDYVTSPKDNGYQSIHTVVIGPEGKTVEIQIRTHEMHQHAEYGIAAHWKYKEGGKGYDARLEASINAMRQLLEHRDDAEVFDEISTELQSQHIYVLTPTNQIITLPQNATALDFAYAIHTDLGHGCRGAKINGHIIPLTQTLKTGDRIEVLSMRNGEPNRNWLNPNLGYIKTSRARTRIRSWFNRRNKEANIELGEQLYAREAKRLNAKHIAVAECAKYFGFEQLKDFYEALGKGQLNERQLLNALQKLVQPGLLAQKKRFNVAEKKPQSNAQITDDSPQAYVVGAPNLRTTLAPCCEPKPADDIIGFVTRGRGVTIHRQDCNNILNLADHERQRLIAVNWLGQAEPASQLLQLTLHILAFDRKGLLRDVMAKLTDFDVNLTRSNTVTNQDEGTVDMALDIEVTEQANLGALLDQVEAITNVEEVSILAQKEQNAIG
ncbi:bifunctional (p)ppGpp synthetase/guanosine-3',5'-bis(diphosphate) 3'-pyrophosphohydrolase [Thiomicrospira sp. ALE5]|uniref:RelA/SpoT family protein n=1 Tax=Thiomicrospira sp. ALE5 TaxID=748650 RepID=UPI0008E07200|nr:bifunctional (p)ppGpp synthetase/guanosine-3',5'-bis(diphosphate) 3'-pyrophosphohydrolase [Thiomicrospira sp. ALE5]SFR50143.1 GTP pyrophosphokinase [Thiomicrospira sp. ALE5]